MAEARGTGRLSAAVTPAPADAFLIMVPTPVTDGPDPAPDLSFVDAACQTLAPHLAPGAIVLLGSTSPVGTTRRIMAAIARARPDLVIDETEGSQVDFAYMPERVIPGRTMIEMVENDRLIGGVTPRATARGAALLARYATGDILRTTDKTAEMVKLVENAWRDVSIGFANEVAEIAEAAALDPRTVIALANRHPRVNILSPGVGVGGHCIPIDPWFLISGSEAPTRLMRAARAVNAARPGRIVQRIEAALARDAAPGQGTPRLACLGLSYKADVDDFRNSPALDVALALTRAHPGRVVVSDPAPQALAASYPELMGRMTVGPAEQAVEGADIVVILVAHSAYRDLPIPEGRVVIDVTGQIRGADPEPAS